MRSDGAARADVVLRADVVVVGGGSAGAVVAGRLALESTLSVLLLERGPDYGPLDEGGWPVDLLDAGALALSHDAGYDSGGTYAERVVDFQRAHVLGGCSAHNGCIAAVGHPSDYDAWGVPGWSGQDLRPLFARALARMRVRTYRDDEASPFHRAAVEAAIEAGHPTPLALDDLDAGVGFGLEAVNVDGGVRFNAAFAYLDSARHRSTLTIRGGTRVDRIEPQTSGGVLVHARRGPQTVLVEAGHVVCAAGVYDTPALLLRSGVGDPDELRRLGVPVQAPLPGVGRNLHDHPMIELVYGRSDAHERLVAQAREQRFVPDEQSLGKFASAHCDGPYDLHVFPVGAATQARDLDRECVIAVAAVAPLSRGAVTLADAHPETAPTIDHRYLSDPQGRDLAVLLEGARLARELASQPSLRPMLGSVRAAFETADDVRAGVAHYFHPAGTCRLGPATDPLAVCDASGRVHGLPDVTVADCSLMPQVPRANTNIPAVVLGEKIADLLLARL